MAFFNTPSRAEKSALRLVDIFLNRGESSSLTNEFMKKALHWSVWENMPVVAEALLAKGTPVDVEDHFGRTPLIVAAEEGHAKLVKILLANGANADHRDYSKHTARTRAMVFGRKKVLGILPTATVKTPELTLTP